MADVQHGARVNDDVVTINAEFVRRQAEAAVRQFFRPVTAAFDCPSPHLGPLIPKETLVPKPPRVEVRGYAIKKHRGR